MGEVCGKGSSFFFHSSQPIAAQFVSERLGGDHREAHIWLDIRAKGVARAAVGRRRGRSARGLVPRLGLRAEMSLRMRPLEVLRGQRLKLKGPYLLSRTLFFHSSV